MRKQILAVGISLSLALMPAVSTASPNTGEALTEETRVEDVRTDEALAEDAAPAGEPMAGQADPQPPAGEGAPSAAEEPATPDGKDAERSEISTAKEFGAQPLAGLDGVLAPQAAYNYALADGRFTPKSMLFPGDASARYTFTLHHRSRIAVTYELDPIDSYGTIYIQPSVNKSGVYWNRGEIQVDNTDQTYSDVWRYNDMSSPLSVGPGQYTMAVWYDNPTYSNSYCWSRVKLEIKPLFDDLPNYHWAANVVADAVDKRFMSGYNASRFGTGDSITRAQVATVLWNMQGKPRPRSTYSFRDVGQNKYYSQAIAWAKSAGVVSGYGNGSFCPDKNVSRQELAVMLHNYAVRYRGASNSGASSASYSGMSDRGSVAAYARNAVGWCFSKGIMSGSGGLIRPGAPASRAEAAKMFLLTGNLLGI